MSPWRETELLQQAESKENERCRRQARGSPAPACSGSDHTVRAHDSGALVRIMNAAAARPTCARQPDSAAGARTVSIGADAGQHDQRTDGYGAAQSRGSCR